MNVKEAAKHAGTSVRTMRYYEEIGLIQPIREENGYREYEEAQIERVRLIRAYRELQFSLEEIRILLDAQRMERDEILCAQIERLEEKRQIIDNRIALAQSLRMLGPERLAEIDFSQVDAQMAQSRKYLEENEEMRKISDRLKKVSQETGERIAQELIGHLADIANAPEKDVHAKIEALKQFIDTHLYPCTDQILIAYARAYGGDGILTQALEEIGGTGAGERLRQRLEPKSISS